MLSFAAKVFNQNPKPASKSQKLKEEKAKSKKVNFVECSECHRHDVTLYKHQDEYYCKEHRV